MDDRLCTQYADALQELCRVTSRVEVKLDRIIERIDDLEAAKKEHALELETLKKNVAIAGWTRKGVAMFAASGAAVGILAFFTGVFKAGILWIGNKL